MKNEAYIYDAIRTPRGKGKSDGSLHEVKPVTLLGDLLNELKVRNNLDTSQVEDIVIGCVTPLGDQGGNIAKTAALYAGWDDVVAGFQLNRFCASGLEAVNLAAMKVISGWEDLVVAGGVESMSRVTISSDGGALGLDPETSLKTGFIPQGVSADLIATLEGFSREDVDAFALESQKKAAEASEKGHFSKSLVPVKDRNGLTILGHDEFIRKSTTMEGLAQLKPSFEGVGAVGFDTVALRKYTQLKGINHVHTPGNSSGIVDGAAAVLVGSSAKGKELGLTPRGRVVAGVITSCEPTIMLTGPTAATRKVLQKAGLKISDIDLFEVNEAFAAVVMKFRKDLDIPAEKINVNGGAIAMGHPLGASGAMILGTVLDELERRRLRYGLCTLCVGGGIGIATIVERL
ncbi:thiolase [Geobacter metallireducens GS-15]|uniref:Thiolase n=1 Tax=Geobacter metallireducens (strain ATCC 53774 / DSM 7210 / GS-15) TaxID=269799 RepID=Q39TK0_GEOMG|nr:acetyl-CoA C-acetyltransferase [Geobacter metallireducens]ABB32424.1 thiolase [Geobacter metallireducens GS-15]